VGFTAGYQLPRAAAEEAALALICDSVDRVLPGGVCSGWTAGRSGGSTASTASC